MNAKIPFDVWQWHAEALEQGAQEAIKLCDTDPVAGNIQFASLWYSYATEPWQMLTGGFWRRRRLAREYAQAALDANKGQEYPFTAGQCDTLATILKHVNPSLALELYNRGLVREDALPHERGLLLIGKAEVLHQLRGGRSFQLAEEALKLESQVMAEENKKQAHRQWLRVLRRAAFLLAISDDHERRGRATSLYWQAVWSAKHPEYGSYSQRRILLMRRPAFYWRLLRKH